MQFFIPRADPARAEQAYLSIKDALFSQFRLPIQDRRIFRLDYINSKKHWQAEVGQAEQQERRYEVLAIFESKQFIIFTRTPRGEAGPIILVDKSEATNVEDFE